MENPSWKLPYPSLDSPALKSDLSAAQKLVMEIEALGKPDAETDAGLEAVQRAIRLTEQAGVLVHNLHVYANCLLSEDASLQPARAMASELETLSSRISQLWAPWGVFLQRCSEDFFRRVIAPSDLAGHAFSLERERELKPFLLSEPEEVLLRAMAVSGHQAWGNLYDELSGNGKCRVKLSAGEKIMGLAEAQGLTYGPDGEARRAAWTGVQEFWQEHRFSAAGIVNALAGWRIELARQRSRTQPREFLDQALFDNHISRATLEAILEGCRKNLPQLRRAPLLMAKLFGHKKLDPWDALAPSPIAGGAGMRPFGEAMRAVEAAFDGVDTELGDFARLALKSGWIEGRVLPNKGGGAYCTVFPKELEPRVFQTYLGSMGDVTTLAHELGHAYHSWMMRDLPRPQQNYPSTLAETASVFAETALRDQLLSQSKSREEKIEAAWSDVESALGYLINIPARFEFENEFHERRKKSFVGADELSALTDEVWTRWYGDTLSQNDRLFWAHKMHFSLYGSGFYNFPYAFGYLFALSIYSRRESLGKDFFPVYKNLLRDTGRMTAEELVKKHLGENIETAEFWQKALDGVIGKLNQFEELL